MSYVTVKGLLRPLQGSIYDAHRICIFFESILNPNYMGLDGALKHSAGSFGGRPCRGNHQTACFPWHQGFLQCNDGQLQNGKQLKSDIMDSLRSIMDKPADAVARPLARYTLSQGGTSASTWMVRNGANASTRGLSTNYFSNLGGISIRCFSSKLSEDIESIPLPHNRTFKVEATYVGSNINVYDLLKLPIYSANFKAVHKGSALIGLQSKHKEHDVQQVRNGNKIIGD